MTDLPQWAMEKAEELRDGLYPVSDEDGRAYIPAADLPIIARALVEAEARGIERAADVARRSYVKPSNDNYAHPVSAANRRAFKIYAAIRKLMEQDNG